MVIKNLVKTANRIVKAIRDKERIVLYGDTDLDGVCSVIILKEALQTKGANIVSCYFPDREKEGYGITTAALESLKEHAPAVFIAMDLGVSSYSEVNLAKKMGFSILILDHHEIVQKIPLAYSVVDPKQKGDNYPFKGFAACGLSLRLVEKILGRNISPSLHQSLFELAALGTIGDMMPQKDDNVEIITEGYAALQNSWRPGIRAFMEMPDIQGRESFPEKVTRIISTLNVRDVENGFPAAFRLLTCTSEKEARKLAEELMEKHRVRKESIEYIVEKIRKVISKEKNVPLIFYGESSFEYILLGTVASMLAEEYNKPAFLYRKKEKESIGSVRAPSGYNTVEAMKSCADCLLSFGGHPQASGFRLPNGNSEKFKKCLAAYFTKHQAN